MSPDVRISLRGLAPPGTLAEKWLSILGPVLDRLLKIRAIDTHYQQGGLAGLPPFEFAARALRVLNVSADSSPDQLWDRVPREGPVLAVCNHPYGGIEALILAAALKSVRTDVKFLANAALSVFREFEPLIITTNPLAVTQRNLTSIRQCEAHLHSGGLLVVFPAGRVSFHQRAKGRIADGDWNRIVGHLALRTEAALLPVQFHGANSRMFHVMGRLWDRSKLLMLPRELLKLRGRRIGFSVGRPIAASVWRHMNVRDLTRYARVMTYLQDARTDRWPADAAQSVLQPLAPRGDTDAMGRELDALPAAQRLLDFKQLSVFFAMAHHAPLLLSEIARERERIFRVYDEGSGQPRDGDQYDQTYVQLVVWDNQERSLVGAYRLGKTDELRRQRDPSAIYLSQMFHFDDAFYETAPPSLELGRSFVVPEHQKSYHALYLLWQGIGRFLLAHPQYRRLYGTVSLSRQYDQRAVAVLCDALITPSPHVRPRRPLIHALHPEWKDFRSSQGTPDLPALSALVRGLDAEGKDLPILLKHYYKLGAKFHCVGVDPNFNATPGLLLSVDVPALAPKVLSTFLGSGAAAYLAFDSTRQYPGAAERAVTSAGEEGNFT